MIFIQAIIALILIGYLFIRFSPAFGSRKSGEQSNMGKSLNFKNGKFQNPVETRVQVDHVPYLKLFREFLSTKENRVPSEEIQVKPIEKEVFHQQTNGVKICWLGHSSMVVEIEGKIILIDPVFSKRVSPFSFLGTKAFPYSKEYSLADLPQIDLVLISHDHYDHLDYKTIKRFQDQNVKFLTTLGVGDHLESWGINRDRITELDWWDEYQLTNEIRLIATPARHFSGRGLTNRFSTLWASWVIAGANHRVFFGADSGYFPGFKTIGEKFGPFNLAMLECGQYSQYWPSIHMAPEETFQAAKDLNAKSLLPIHWGKFKLSIHPWTEPIERLIAANNENKISIATPKIGQTIDLANPLPNEFWWRQSTKD